MTLLLKQIFAFLRLLNSETGTNQIASGIAAGFILGMTPALSLQSIVVFLCIFAFRIQAGAAFLSAFFFAFVAYLLDPVFHEIGAMALQIASLQSLFTTLYNLPLVPLTRFNNSIVMGSGIVTFVCAPFVFLISKILVQKYRVHIVTRIKDTKTWKLLQATKFYQWYAKYDQFYG